jgi:hypothetical protein
VISWLPNISRKPDKVNVPKGSTDISLRRCLAKSGNGEKAFGGCAPRQ